MKKQALSALLTLCLLLGLLPATAFAADPPHSHPICGAACSGHDTSHGDETWTAWDGTGSITTPDNYYLTRNVTRGRLDITCTVNLCLNGHTISGSSSIGGNQYLIHVGTSIPVAQGTLNICDCKGTGAVKREAGIGITTLCVYEESILNIYGGTITGKGPTIQLDGGTVNLYSGTVTGTNGAGITANTGPAHITILGGTVTGTTSGVRFITGAYGENVLTLGGSPSISGNKSDIQISTAMSSTEDSVTVLPGFAGKHSVIVGDPSKITEAGPGTFTAAADVDYTQYFTAKDSGLAIRNVGEGAQRRGQLYRPHVWDTETWESDDNGHWHKCTNTGCTITNYSVCGETDAAYTAHIYDNDRDTDCNICGYTRTVHSHSWARSWSHDNIGHWHECDSEGCPITDNADKDGYGPHDFTGTYLSDASGHWHKCKTCDATDTRVEHEYTNGRDTDCNVCGYQRTVALSGVVSISGTEKIGETLTATVSGTPANVPLKYAWTVSGGDGTVLGTGLSYTPTTAGEVGRELTFTVSTEDPRYTGSLSASTDPVAKGDQAAPSRELFHVTDAEQGQSNGAIAVSGDAGALEYRAKPADGGDPAYTAAAARIENLAAGWYQFRYRETAVYTAGNVTELEVRSLTPAAKDLTIDGGIAHGSVTAVRSKVNPGDTVKLTVTPEAGYQLTAIAANYGGGQTVTPVWDEAVGAYTFTMPDAAVTVTAVFSAVRPPEGGDSSSDDDDDRDSPSAGGRPSVSVSGKGGAVTADRDGSVTVTPDKGYVIDRVTVNGKEVNVPEDGKLTGLKRTDKVTVTFKEEAFEPSPVTVDRFTDVKSGDWFYAGVKAAVEQELMNGVTEEAFAPHMTTDRAMIATILWRLEGEPKGAAAQDFPDVAEGQWYTEAIGWAAAKGVVTGYGGGSFGPLDLITREQFAVMLWRYAGSPAGTGTLAAFTDADRVSTWAADALCWAVEQGILTGRGGGVLDPTGQATRAEAAAMLMRYCQRTEK